MPQRHIFLHPLGHLVRIADQRGACAAAHQPDPCPQVRAHLQLVATAAVQRRHALLPD